MAEDDKMFTCVKSGVNFKINPRNAAGWRAFALWMAGFFAVLAVFLSSIGRIGSNASKGGLVALFLLATAIWVVTMVRWMMARSEMIDVKELLEIKRELERQKRQGR